MNVSVLTNNGCPNSRAFNCPLLAAKRALSEKGVSLKFFFGLSDALYRNDCLFVNSNVFRPYWKTAPEKIFAVLDRAREAAMKILWFDTTDSAWVTQFPVLPKVDLFLKSQIYADLNEYRKRYRTGRVFTDYFDSLYKAGERDFDYALPDPEELRKKLRVSWNTCFENYTEKRYGLLARLRQKARTWFPVSERFDAAFTPPEKPRARDISCRLGVTYDRPSVTAHRKAVIALMNARGVDTAKIPLDRYFAEIRDSLIGVGPFGVGEITLRDYEIILCGATLVKPDMTHLQTWPDLFQPEITCVTHRWDLSDLNEAIDGLLAAPARRLRLARKAQEIYRDALSDQGMIEFAERLTGYIGAAWTNKA